MSTLFRALRGGHGRQGLPRRQVHWRAQAHEYPFISSSSGAQAQRSVRPDRATLEVVVRPAQSATRRSCKSFLLELLSQIADAGADLPTTPRLEGSSRDGQDWPRISTSFSDYYRPGALPKHSTGPIEVFDPVNPENNIADAYSSDRARPIGAAEARPTPSPRRSMRPRRRVPLLAGSACLELASGDSDL
jgi:hypothetical protein